MVLNWSLRIRMGERNSKKDGLGKYVSIGALIGAGIGVYMGVSDMPVDNSLLENIMWATPTTLGGIYGGAIAGVLTNYFVNRRGNPDFSR